MKRYILGILTLSIFLCSFQTYALSQSEIEKSYTTFLAKISEKYSENEQNNLLKRLSKSISSYQDSINNTDKLSVLLKLEFLNNEEIFQRFEEKELSLSEQKAVEKSLAGISQTGKRPYSELAQDFKGILTQNWKITKDNQYFYSHKFRNYLAFDDKYGTYTKALEHNNIIPSKSFVYKNPATQSISFVTDYISSKLVSIDSLGGIANKQQILSSLRKDIRYETPDMTERFTKISAITKIITRNKNDEQKIAAIYKWILENISYSKVIDFENQQIFSGIETFTQGSGVCTGYTRLFLYMLSVAGIHDVEVIEGHVIDAPDFPQIGHAWVRIGDRYYDPTFDDPVGANKTKSADEYKYYGLPRDIFYANRYDYDNLPVTLKLASKSEITKHIHDRLLRLVPKYKNSLSLYPVFQPVMFREKYNISPLTKLTPELLSEKIGSNKVLNDSFRYTDTSGNTKRITAIQYFILTADNTSQVLEQLNYNESKLNLFHWQKADETWEWRLIYELKQK